MNYKELMEAFVARYGLPGLEMKEGCVVLDINGVSVAFMENESSEAILLHAVIGAPPPDADGSLSKQMLLANHALCDACGATLCQNPETKEYVAILTFPLIVATPELLVNAVGNLLTTVTKWKEILSSNYSERPLGGFRV